MATSNNIITIRRHDLDNLKSFLTGLVVVHHASIPYGGEGGWAFRSQLVSPDSYSVPLLLFEGVNQSFFMGLFFWMSGRMSAQSLCKPGASPTAFLQSKLVRLGIPSVVNTVIGVPLALCISKGRLHGVFPEWWSQLRGIRGVTWFTATLLAFDAVAATLHALLRDCRVGARDSENWTRSFYEGVRRYGWMVSAAACFLLRLKYPVGAMMAPLGIQPAYAPQYALAYMWGYLSLANGEERMMGPLETRTEGDDENNKSAGYHPSLATAVAVSTFSLIGALVKPVLAGNASWMGGRSLNAACYALWGEASFMLIGPALMEYFRMWHAEAATSKLWQTRYTYVAFLCHPHINTIVQVGLDKMVASVDGAVDVVRAGGDLSAIALTGIPGALCTVASFMLGRELLCSFPILGKVL